MAIDIEAQKQNLTEALARVTEELKGLGIHNPDVAEDWIATPAESMEREPDENDAADRVEAWDERRAELSVLERTYNDTKAALARIDAGTYGTCAVCGQPIEAERLLVEPAAQTCIAHRDEPLG
jgi:RNA polymerase-binding transcription factor DksA